MGTLVSISDLRQVVQTHHVKHTTTVAPYARSGRAVKEK